jgi:hypothetical protein
MLAQDGEFQHMGVCVHSYRADWRAGDYSIDDASGSLRDLADIYDLWHAPWLFFICHSMGGLVARRFVVAHQRRLIDSKCKIGFFLIASPSIGSRHANYIAFLSRMLRSTQAQALRFSQQNTWLNALDQDFQRLKDSGGLFMTGKELVEDEPVKIKRFIRLFSQTVEPFSANRYFSDYSRIDYSDHVSICKPASVAARQHLLLKHFIKTSLYYSSSASLEQINPEETQRTVNALRQLKDRLATKSIPQYEVLAALQGALKETESYLRRRNEGGERDPATEQSLSDVWIEAGNAIRQYDQALAQLCYVKGHGWANEAVWNDPDLKKLPTDVDSLLKILLAATERASNSAKKREPAPEIVEGQLKLDTLTWRTKVLLPPFAAPPEITLVRPDGRSVAEPKLESVTGDAFTASIRSRDQRGTWNWRARGPRLGPTLTVVDGEVRVDTLTWRTTVLLPPFAYPPEITLLRPEGGSREEPEVESVTADKFTAVIRSTDQAGIWIWRARGVPLSQEQVASL